MKNDFVEFSIEFKDTTWIIESQNGSILLNHDLVRNNATQLVQIKLNGIYNEIYSLPKYLRNFIELQNLCNQAEILVEKEIIVNNKQY